MTFSPPPPPIKGVPPPVSTKTPDERIVYRVMAIELEVKSEQFRLCFMSQNRAVVENKRVLPSSYPVPEQSSSFLRAHYSG